MREKKTLKPGTISGEIVTVWAACWSDDERGPDEPREYHLQKSAADARVVSPGWYGAPGTVTKETALKVDGDYYLLAKGTPTRVVDPAADKHREALKAAAKAKLMPEELAALLGDEDEEDEDDD